MSFALVLLPLDKVYALGKEKINKFILFFALVLLPLHGNLKIMAKAQSKKVQKIAFFLAYFKLILYLCIRIRTDTSKATKKVPLFLCCFKNNCYFCTRTPEQVLSIAVAHKDLAKVVLP